MAIPTDSIDHITLLRLVEAQAIRGADIIGQAGGWGIIVKYGMVERPLVTRTGSLRIFKKLETVVAYLKGIGIVQFFCNASNYDPEAVKNTIVRPDVSKRMKQAFKALERVNQAGRPEKTKMKQAIINVKP